MSAYVKFELFVPVADASEFHDMIGKKGWPSRMDHPYDKQGGRFVPTFAEPPPNGKNPESNS